ncbi:FtsH protease activity modulator HflK [Sulfuriferula thiophila]|uniref:FtsH protease activity modulator HflK n=1 Tax=Sulfuriferula thiophila TaxID=1781211 RepID=UPI000F611BD8|nr:FtsH protease activity modulator HflK [Sulfuriferula thiophila]
MAWNDPQWGKKNDGPPDLDEIWRRFNEKLNGLFGGKPSTPNSGKSFNKGGLAIIAGVIIAIWLASGFYIVDTGERGVVLRFGKFVETTQPGPNWHLPFPMETVEVVNIEQVRTVEVGYRNNVKSKMLKESLMLTDDENIVDIQFAVQYTLKDPEDYLFSNRSPDDAVRQAAESVMSETVGKSKMDYVLYEGRADVAARATKNIQDALDRYKTGISVSKVTLQNAQPPQEVQSAFDDAVKAGQDRERLKSEGQAYANDVIPKARGMAARLTEESNGYKQSVIANAEGEASRFKQVLVEYSKAPAVTRDRMYMDMMQQVLTSTSKVLVDSSKGGNNLIYLPLDKLMQMTGPSANNATTSSSTSSVPDTVAIKPTPADPAAQDTGRTRDAFRSREREDRP